MASPLLAKVFIQPELLYSQQGYKITNSSGTFTQKLDYINLPIMLKAYPSKKISFEAWSTNKKDCTQRGIFRPFSGSQEYDPNNFDWGLNFEEV
jgi:hypothetical protein